VAAVRPRILPSLQRAAHLAGRQPPAVAEAARPAPASLPTDCSIADQDVTVPLPLCRRPASGVVGWQRPTREEEADSRFLCPSCGRVRPAAAAGAGTPVATDFASSCSLTERQIRSSASEARGRPLVPSESRRVSPRASWTGQPRCAGRRATHGLTFCRRRVTLVEPPGSVVGSASARTPPIVAARTHCPTGTSLCVSAGRRARFPGRRSPLARPVASPGARVAVPLRPLHAKLCRVCFSIAAHFPTRPFQPEVNSL
jgi:hypothetical protein